MNNNNPDPIPNYTGPYISDGSIQESVAFGDATPKDELDKLSRIHDTHYANYDDIVHRMVADKMFYDDAIKLPGLTPEVAAYLVSYGNHTARSTMGILSGFKTGGPVGAFVGAVTNLYHLMDYTMNRDRYAKDMVKSLLKDPHYNDPNYYINDRSTKTFGNINSINRNQRARPPLPAVQIPERPSVSTTRPMVSTPRPSSQPINIPSTYSSDGFTYLNVSMPRRKRKRRRIYAEAGGGW